jgi:UDP-N-acetylmuramate dehydrogenase
MTGWFRENAERFSGQLLFDEPLSRHTYYRIGGPARVLAIPKSVDDLKFLADGLRATQLPLFVLGLGSNVLVADEGLEALVVKSSRLNLETFAVSPTRLRTGASVAVSSLLRRGSTEGWAGLELLTGIPGSIGGVVTMNAGTHLGEAKDRLTAVEFFPLLGASAGEALEPVRVERGELRFEYRKNLFLPRGALVWSAEWEIAPGDPAQVKGAIDETLARRKATQPLDSPSCGSVFKNPAGKRAWEVIDALGLRGHRIGDAQFAEKHGNFILNLGAARARDVSALIAVAKRRALDELGVTLEEEVLQLRTTSSA